jgi:hypothetical protein
MSDVTNYAEDDGVFAGQSCSQLPDPTLRTVTAAEERGTQKFAASLSGSHMLHSSFSANASAYVSADVNREPVWPVLRRATSLADCPGTHLYARRYTGT